MTRDSSIHVPFSTMFCVSHLRGILLHNHHENHNKHELIFLDLSKLVSKKIGIPLIFQDWSNRHWSCHETQTYIYIRELCVFLCATWPTTRDSLRYVTWLMSRDSIVYIFVHPMYFYARHDCISMRDMTHNSDSLRYVTWLLTRDSIVYIYSCILCISMHNMTHNSRLIKTCDMTHDSWLNRKYIVVHSM